MLDAILNALPRKLTSLEAKLQGVSGFTGRGKVNFTAWNSGAQKMQVELHGIAGRSAEIFINDVFFVKVDLNNGRVKHMFSSRKRADIPNLTKDWFVDVRQNGEKILEGALHPRRLLKNFRLRSILRGTIPNFLHTQHTEGRATDKDEEDTDSPSP